MLELIEPLIKAFIMLLVIMDPFGGIPVFILLTKGYKVDKIKNSANRATKVATILIFIFIFLGSLILDFFSISLESFKIAGGIILFLVGLTYVLDFNFGDEKKNYEKDIVIPMATPLIAGPGVLTATIILVSMYGLLITSIAATLNLLIFWLLMRKAHLMYKIIGNQGAEILSRIMGLILTAMATEFIITGIQALL